MSACRAKGSLNDWNLGHALLAQRVAHTAKAFVARATARLLPAAL
jgi:hypothetical protein